MRTLVTGGAGFIGSHLLRHLAKTDPASDLFNAGTRDPGIPGVRHLDCDLTAESPLLEWMRDLRPERVYHMAGASRIADTISFPEYFQKNYLTTVNTLRGLESPGHRATIFFASSIHVYGNQQGIVDETCPPKPRTTYGFSKYLAEEALRAAALREGGPRVIIGRFYNCIGPGQPEGFVASDLCTRLAHLEKVNAEPLRSGPLSSFRSFLDVRDAVKILPALMRARLPSAFEIFNLAAPRTLEIRELLAILLREAGRSPAVETIETLAANPFTGLEVSLDKLRKSVPLPAFRPIERTLKEMLQHARRQRI